MRHYVFYACIELHFSFRRQKLSLAEIDIGNTSRVFVENGLISRINDTYLDQTQDSREFLYHFERNWERWRQAIRSRQSMRRMYCATIHSPLWGKDQTEKEEKASRVDSNHACCLQGSKKCSKFKSFPPSRDELEIALVFFKGMIFISQISLKNVTIFIYNI